MNHSRFVVAVRQLFAFRHPPLSLSLSLSFFLSDFDTVQWKVRHKCRAVCCRRQKAACCKQGNERLVPLTALVALRTKYCNMTALRVPTVQCYFNYQQPLIP
jgi:hypothetical protein